MGFVIRERNRATKMMNAAFTVMNKICKSP